VLDFAKIKVGQMSQINKIAEKVVGHEDDEIARQFDVAAHNRNSAYNVPGYKPVHSELSHERATVSGKMPADLEGVYLRNGTNLQFDNPRTRLHAFNGSGMLHQIQLRNGEAAYSNCYIRTPRFEYEGNAGGEIYAAFSDQAGGGRMGLARVQLAERRMRDGVIPRLSPLEASNASTSVQCHEGKIYCLSEVAFPFVLNARLESGRLVLDGRGRLENWGGRLQHPFTAHPSIDGQTGALYNLSVDRHGAIHYSRLENGDLTDVRTIHQQDVNSGIIGFLHDFIVSDNHIVFPDTSLRMQRERILSETGSVYYFDPDYKLRWGVMSRYPKDGEQVRWFSTDQVGHIWHMINGWERVSHKGSNEIVLYAPVFETYPADLPIHSPREPHAKVKKWVLDISTGETVSEEVLIDHPYERPGINGGYFGKSSRFAYLLDESSGYMGKGVLKYDLLNERDVEYFGYGDALGGEPLFVPRQGSVEEDDGYLLDLLMRDESAELIVIDAKKMSELARVHLPARVPFGVHAYWLGASELDMLVRS
jgi:carotenoid cleavage dioxygenase-like enzyme